MSMQGPGPFQSRQRSDVFAFIEDEVVDGCFSASAVGVVVNKVCENVLGCIVPCCEAVDFGFAEAVAVRLVEDADGDTRAQNRED